MNLIRDHIDYLKDNPEGYWFKRKLYGYGWTPAKPAGWAVIIVYILFLGGVVWYAQASGLCIKGEPSILLISLILVSTALLLAIAWKTGEPLKWQWGKKEEDQK